MNIGDILINNYTQKEVTILEIRSNGDVITTDSNIGKIKYSADLIDEHWEIKEVSA